MIEPYRSVGRAVFFRFYHLFSIWLVLFGFGLNQRTRKQKLKSPFHAMIAATNMRSLLLSLSTTISLGLCLCTPTSGFHVEPNGIIPPMSRRLFRPFPTSSSMTSTQRLLSANDELSNKNSREEEMMDQVLMEQEFQRIQRKSVQRRSGGIDPTSPQQRIDPLIAGLTRIDEPTPNNIPMVQVPLFGEIPADGNLGLLAPAAAIGILGFIFSIVVALNSRDSIVDGFSSVVLPKMEYTPTVVEEGKCRGLCSSQAEDLDGLRNFMESILRK